MLNLFVGIHAYSYIQCFSKMLVLQLAIDPTYSYKAAVSSCSLHMLGVIMYW